MPLGASNISDQGGKTLYGGDSADRCEKGQQVWAKADPFITYVCKYATRTKTIKTVYTSWSDWQSAASSANNREVESITLYQYQPKTYSVSYRSVAGTGLPSAQTKIHGEGLHLSEQKPQRDGYAFVGWATSADGGVAYKAGQQYTGNNDLTLYAVWEADTYTVSYDANGGTGAPPAQTKKHDSSLRISAQVPTKIDCVFLGWSTTPNGNVAFAPDSVCNLNQNVTLYALWQEEVKAVYYIIYNANGGVDAPAMQTKYENEDIKISMSAPTRKGYEFVGWAVGSNDTVVYTSGDTCKENKTLYLYAVWKAENYTVSYNANGGSGAPQGQTATYGEPVRTSAIEPTKENYRFVGWSESRNASRAEYLAGDSLIVAANTVLYAVWAEPTAQAEALPFEDVPNDAWYREDLESAYNSGLINGRSERRYGPTENITFAETIKLACTIYQLYYDGEVTLERGADVWYSTYMEFAQANRIVRTDYSSVANKYVTRREFVNIFYGALPASAFAKINNVADNAIPDVKLGDAYAGEIYAFYRAGILIGNDRKGTFKPDSNIARSEVAALVTRMLDTNARKTISLQGTNG